MTERTTNVKLSVTCSPIPREVTVGTLWEDQIVATMKQIARGEPSVDPVVMWVGENLNQLDDEYLTAYFADLCEVMSLPGGTHILGDIMPDILVETRGLMCVFINEIWVHKRTLDNSEDGPPMDLLEDVRIDETTRTGELVLVSFQSRSSMGCGNRYRYFSINRDANGNIASLEEEDILSTTETLAFPHMMWFRDDNVVQA
jgi:hypothetical protein